MAINFPSNPTDAQEVTEGNVTYVYNATKGYWESTEDSSGASTTVYANMTALIAATGMSNGDQAFVTGNNNLYIYSGSGWYKVATVQNDAPSAITGVSGTYELAIDGTATTITAVSTDPEGFPLTWSYSTSGLGSIATVSQVDNVFTITPSTTEADAGTFSLTINATDGVNGAVSANTNLTLEFIVIVENSKYTTLLATAVDTSDNNNITDSSSNNHSITVNGDAHAGTFSPYRSGGYSTYFDGTGDYLQTPTINLTGDFTVEFFISLDELTTDVGIFSFGNLAGANSILELYSNTSGYYRLYSSTGGELNTSNISVDTGKFYHIAVTRSGNTFKAYLDGVEFASDTTARTINSVLTIGGYVNTGYLMKGYIRDFRITTNVQYSSNNFTPPSEPLTAISGTVLLTCHLPYIADGSATPYTMTSYGDVSTKPFSPYDYNEYDAADYGGSVYFDGTGDYLVASNNTDTFGTGDFTLEGWIYRTATGYTWQSIVAQRNGPSTNVNEFVWGVNNSGYMYFYTGAHVASTAAGLIKLNQWHHIAFTRSGSTLRQFVDGIQQVSGTSSNNLTYGPISIGNNNGGAELLTAFLSDIKITKGTALYTSNFTPPTEPISSANSLLHIKGTDASIIDNSQGSNLTLVGNTTGSTTQVKFADTKSIYFASTSATDYASSKHGELLSLSGPFTIEFWCNMNTGGAANYTSFFYWTGTNYVARLTDSGFGNRLHVCFDAQSSSAFYAVNATRTYLAGLGWFHFAWTRDNNNDNRIFINGSIVNVTGGLLGWSSYPSPSSFPASSFNDNRTLGSSADFVFAAGDGGYIQDFRITKGLARYTANFTPPTASLEG